MKGFTAFDWNIVKDPSRVEQGLSILKSAIAAKRLYWASPENLIEDVRLSHAGRRGRDRKYFDPAANSLEAFVREANDTHGHKLEYKFCPSEEKKGHVNVSAIKWKTFRMDFSKKGSSISTPNNIEVMDI